MFLANYTSLPKSTSKNLWNSATTAVGVSRKLAIWYFLYSYVSSIYSIIVDLFSKKTSQFCNQATLIKSKNICVFQHRFQLKSGLPLIYIERHTHLIEAALLDLSSLQIFLYLSLHRCFGFSTDFLFR
jgi:hypothetical protein